MKKLLYFFIGLAFVITACSDGDESNANFSPLEDAPGLPTLDETKQDSIDSVKAVLDKIKQDSIDAASAILNGKIFGNDWTLMSAKAIHESLDNRYNIEFYGEDLSNVCSTIAVQTPHLFTFVTDAVGRYEYPAETLIQNMEFRKGDGTRERNSSGFIQIIEITGNTIIGIADVTVDDDNFVKGAFTATICQ